MTQNEWARLLKAYHAAKVAADAVKTFGGQIKAGLAEEGKTEITAGGFIARVTTVESTRLDTKALKEKEPETYKKYTVPTTTERLYFK